MDDTKTPPRDACFDFDAFPEGTRILIKDGKVTFENMTVDLLEVALALDPDNKEMNERRGKCPRKGKP